MPLRRPGGAGKRLRSPSISPSWRGLATKTAEGLKNTPRFLEAEAGQVLDAAKAAIAAVQDSFHKADSKNPFQKSHAIVPPELDFDSLLIFQQLIVV